MRIYFKNQVQHFSLLAGPMLASICLACIFIGCDTETEGAPQDSEASSDDPTLTVEEAKKHCPGDLDEVEGGGFDCHVQGGDISSETFASEDDLVWIQGITYYLGGVVRIMDDAELVIEPGARIVGDPTVPSNFQTGLVIARGSKIQAVGTEDNPIVFSSGKPPGERAPGDWGGIVIAGKAPVACGSDAIRIYQCAENALNSAFNPPHEIGGEELEDSTGAFAYVRIEFAGRKPAVFEGETEAQFAIALSLQGLGSKSDIHHIQIHRPAGTGLEVIGGAIPLRHIVVDGAEGTGILWRKGWVGRSQFVISHQTSAASLYSGLEGSHQNSDGTYETAPRSAPLLFNYTIAGDDAAGAALHLNGGTAGTLVNFLVADGSGFSPCVDIQNDSTWSQTSAGALSISGSIFPDTDGCFADDDTTGYLESNWWDEGKDNRTASVTLDTANPDGPSFAPASGSPALSGALPPPAGIADIEKVSFVGAVGEEDWTEGWTAYPKN